MHDFSGKNMMFVFVKGYILAFTVDSSTVGGAGLKRCTMFQGQNTRQVFFGSIAYPYSTGLTGQRSTLGNGLSGVEPRVWCCFFCLK